MDKAKTAPKKRTARKTRKISSTTASHLVPMIPPTTALLVQLEQRLPLVIQTIGFSMLMFGVIAMGSLFFLSDQGQKALNMAALWPARELALESTTNAGILDNKTDPKTAALPIVTFRTDNEYSAVHTMVVQTSAGSKTRAFIQNLATGLEQELKVKESDPEHFTWAYTVDVRQLPAGTYQFSARVYVNDQWYENVSKEFTVQPAERTKLTPNDAVGENADVSTEDKSLTGIFGSLPKSISGKMDIKLKTDNVVSALLEIRSETGEPIQDLSPEATSNPNDFHFVLDTSRLPDGVYELAAKLKSKGAEKIIPGPKFQVVNKALNDDAAPTSSPDSPVVTEVSELKIEAVPNETDRYRQYAFSVTDAEFIEVHVLPSHGTKPIFVGLAKRQDADRWAYTIDTAKLPDGEYKVLARYRQNGQLTDVYGPVFKIETETDDAAVPATVPDIIKRIENITPIVDTVRGEVGLPARAAGMATSSDKRVRAPEEPAVVRLNALSEPGLVESALELYTTALRSGDERSIEKAKSDVLKLRVNISPDGEESQQHDVASRLNDLLTRAERADRLIKERTHNEIAIDTDTDGITDFDEVNLYNTDPDDPDTDSDGFTDGAEILAGFDPLAAKAEAAVVYESPQDAGIIRQDILKVENITTVKEAVPANDGVAAKAEITGRALPNSFVTLYIFSTPVVVTIKTNDDGSFAYTFDKELADGEHEVYVGITDNTGAIVAKSSPLRFIKEAEAFTPADAATEAITTSTESSPLSSPFWQSIIFGLIVFVAGLILILLGQQVGRSKTIEATIHAD